MFNYFSGAPDKILFWRSRNLQLWNSTVHYSKSLFVTYRLYKLASEHIYPERVPLHCRKESVNSFGKHNWLLIVYDNPLMTLCPFSLGFFVLFCFKKEHPPVQRTSLRIRHLDFTFTSSLTLARSLNIFIFFLYEIFHCGLLGTLILFTYYKNTNSKANGTSTVLHLIFGVLPVFFTAQI